LAGSGTWLLARFIANTHFFVFWVLKAVKKEGEEYS
jgi:hypothetical protein